MLWNIPRTFKPELLTGDEVMFDKNLAELWVPDRKPAVDHCGIIYRKLTIFIFFCRILSGRTLYLQTACCALLPFLTETNSLLWISGLAASYFPLTFSCSDTAFLI